MSNQPVIDSLKIVLANSYTLYLKTQNFHWNVTGPQFRSLHLLFEEQYTDLQAAVDEIAERIRSLGGTAPGSFAHFLKLTAIKEADSVPDADAMVKALAADQDVIIASLQKTLESAQKAGDEVTVGMVTDRMTIHEKNRWMLKSSL
jgi:starvation-inducible DNA-binding protein